MHFKTKTNQNIYKIIQNNIEITDPRMIANAFNSYFTNIGNNLANQIPNVQKSRPDYLKLPSCNSFIFFQLLLMKLKLKSLILTQIKLANVIPVYK